MLMYVVMDVVHLQLSQLMVNLSSNNDHKSFSGTTDENKKRAGNAGAIDVILDMMKTHINNAEICGRGYCALGIITINGKLLSQTINLNHFRKSQKATES